MCRDRQWHWKLTLIVSSGWPAITVQIPPNPPDRKYLIGLVLSDIVTFSSCFSCFFFLKYETINKFARNNEMRNWPLVLRSKWHWKTEFYYLNYNTLFVFGWSDANRQRMVGTHESVRGTRWKMRMLRVYEWIGFSFESIITKNLSRT